MRPIEFRGLDAENGNIWRYGSLLRWPNRVCCIVEFDKEGNEISWDVLPETVGEYTGLRDKALWQIYEGDCLCGPDGRITIVKWDEYECGWNIAGHGIHLCKVVGNVHSNSDFIERSF